MTAPCSAADRLIKRLESGVAAGPLPQKRQDWWAILSPPPAVRLDPPSLAGATEPVATQKTTAREWLHRAESLQAAGIRPSTDEVDVAIETLGAWLAADRRRLIWTAQNASAWMSDLRGVDPDKTGDRPSLRVWWTMCCWSAEAVHRAVDRRECRLLPADRSVVEPLAARLRFLILSEPLRHRGSAESEWFAPIRTGGRQGKITDVFGNDSWDELQNRIREARWAWLRHLDGFTTFPPLVAAGSQALEEELRLVVFTDAERVWLRSALAVREEQPQRHAPPGDDDTAVQADVVENHLLPRFRLFDVALLALRPGAPAAPDGGADAHWVRTAAARVRNRAMSSLPVASAALVMVGVFAVGWFVARWQLQWAGWAAALTYAALVLGVVVNGPLYAAIWLLRWPAAAAIGLIALVGLNKAWWAGGNGSASSVASIGPPAVPPLRVGLLQLPTVTALLTAAAFGYLVLEARNHRVGAWAALLRSAGVLAIGACHALLVALVGLLVILPEFSEAGTDLLTSLTGNHHAAAARLLSDTTAWCLGAGVFSQILWDDRSITAPLAHVRWQSERPR
jgi:hypothetical protein